MTPVERRREAEQCVHLEARASARVVLAVEAGAVLAFFVMIVVGAGWPV